MRISITCNGKEVALFYFTAREGYYAWETIRNFVRTLGNEEYVLTVTPTGEE